jgi:hypothetical protein
LNSVENVHPDISSGTAAVNTKTTVNSWNREFRKVVATTNPTVESGHPHRFATRCCSTGVELSRVSILLGHASIKVWKRQQRSAPSIGAPSPISTH